MFTLPNYKGIEEAMQDVTDLTASTGCEFMIGLRKDGTRAWECTSLDERCVAIPEQFKCADNAGIMVVHSHPHPTQLSQGDLMFTWANRVDGNLAVCPDGTVSWSSGPAMSPPTSYAELDLYRGIRAEAFAEKWLTVASLVLDANRYIDTPEGEVIHFTHDEYVVLSHWVNIALVEHAFLKDYHLHLGEDAVRILLPYEEKFSKAWKDTDAAVGAILDQIGQSIH